MTVASQLIMVPGDAPDVVPAGRKTLFLDAAGVLYTASPDGSVHKPREPEDNAYYLPPVLGFWNPNNGEPELPGGPDRYIATATASGWTANRIYQFNPATGHWTGITPTQGALVMVGGHPYQYTDGQWVYADYFAAAPGHYARDFPWSVREFMTTGNRYTLQTPNDVTVRIDSKGYRLSPQRLMSLADASSWDDPNTGYVVAANRAGRNFYIYVAVSHGVARYVLSGNSTVPTGSQYTTTNTRKVGGFHCLCWGVGTISGHTLSGYLIGDILPASLWDLKHRPVCSPEGMVYAEGINRWVDIYLSSVSSGALVSVYGGGPIADGTSSPAFHWYKFAQWLAAIGKRLPTQAEFFALSAGANQGTNVAGSVDPVYPGGLSDTAGRRMISNIGCEDTCGVLWQWGIEPGGGAGTAAWKNAFDANDANVGGQSYQEPNRVLLGGVWSGGVNCGSRSSFWGIGPLALGADRGARGVAEPLAAGM